jgi:hypothetical protein
LLHELLERYDLGVTDAELLDELAAVTVTVEPGGDAAVGALDLTC